MTARASVNWNPKQDHPAYDLENRWIGNLELSDRRYGAALLNRRTNHAAWLNPAEGYGERRPVLFGAVDCAVNGIVLLVPEMAHLRDHSRRDGTPYLGNLCTCQHPDGQTRCEACARREEV